MESLAEFENRATITKSVTTTVAAHTNVRMINNAVDSHRAKYEMLIDNRIVLKSNVAKISSEKTNACYIDSWVTHNVFHNLEFENLEEIYSSRCQNLRKNLANHREEYS